MGCACRAYIIAEVYACSLKTLILLHTLTKSKQVTYLSLVIPPTTFVFLKASFFILYLQLFRLAWLRLFSWLGLIFKILAYCTLSIFLFVVTTPSKGQTRLVDDVSTKIQKNVQRSVSLARIGLFLDLYILALPMIGVQHFP